MPQHAGEIEQEHYLAADAETAAPPVIAETRNDGSPAERRAPAGERGTAGEGAAMTSGELARIEHDDPFPRDLNRSLRERLDAWRRLRWCSPVCVATDGVLR